ncbi:MAG: CoB--CoM heterodisulfide reductase iron-sulfur subunit B family protein [Dehalococcoidia bacterium]
MKLNYLPGCTLKTRATELDTTTVAAMEKLGIELEELPRWNCCGTVYCFAEDDLMHQIAPVRNLIRAQEQGGGKLVTVCSFCYNTLKRASLLMENDEEKLNILNDFMDEEPDYTRSVSVVHLLELIRDDIGWEEVARHVENPLKGLKVAPYYGCTLHRPKEAAIEPADNRTVLPDLLKTLGADAVKFPDEDKCCGSYQVVANPQIPLNRAREILNSAREKGAEVLCVSCPLCECNLRQMQIKLREEEGFRELPIIYFTQLMALAFGLESSLCQCEASVADASPVLENKGILPARSKA